jgi:hypothetical protein
VSAAAVPLLAQEVPLHRRWSAALLALSILAVASSADATPRHSHRHARGATQAVIVCNERGCSDRVPAAAADAAVTSAETPRAHKRRAHLDANGNEVIISRRPSGCPYEFCGCEASIYLFGHMRRELNLASNWIKAFARTAPAAGMVAARNHHVMVLMRHVDGDEWLVHDGNSGGGFTREHVRSIRGYVIVDPRAPRAFKTVSHRPPRSHRATTVVETARSATEANASANY